MTASTRITVALLAGCLVAAAVMHAAHVPPPSSAASLRGYPRSATSELVSADGLRAWVPRSVIRSSLAIDLTVAGGAIPTPAERKDGYVGIESVVPGDEPGEWVATTPHAAHWFDRDWHQVAVTDLKKRYRRTHPVRFAPAGPLTLVAEDGSGRLIEFDRAGREVGRMELGKADSFVFADVDGHGAADIAAISGKTVVLWRRDGTRRQTIVLDEFVTDLDAVQAIPGGGVELLVYSFLTPARGAWLRIFDRDGERIREWHEADPARSSVVERPTGPLLVSHRDGTLRLRDVTGRIVATRESPYTAQTRYARAVQLASGHEVFLCYNRYRDAHVLLIYDWAGHLVHAERPGSFASTLWSVAEEPGAFFVAVGPDIVRYRIRP